VLLLFSGGGFVQRASALRRPLLPFPADSDPAEATLLDLVRAVSEETADDREVVATVLHLLRSGRVRLVGNFRGQRF
jgi:hypothetical protein